MSNNHTDKNIKFKLFFFSFCFLLISHLNSQNLPNLGEQSALALNYNEEKKIGTFIFNGFKSSDKYVKDYEINSYLNNIGQELVALTDSQRIEYKFFCIKSPQLNAFALPGGYIGINSGLISKVANESELASVIAHEIAHVNQRHVARMIEKKKNMALTSVGAFLLAIIAAKSKGDSSLAAISASQAGTIQQQLRYSREFENEADRYGLEILKKSRFQIQSFPVFLKRLNDSRSFDQFNAPEYLRTHPITSNRIADIENRLQREKIIQVVDSLDFFLIKTKIMLQGYDKKENLKKMKILKRQKKYSNKVANTYGLALAHYDLNNFEESRIILENIVFSNPHPFIMNLYGKALIRSNMTSKAENFYKDTLSQFPHSMNLIVEYTDLLLKMQRYNEIIDFIRKKLVTMDPNFKLYSILSKAYFEIDENFLFHKYQSESYLLNGSVRAAIEQLYFAIKYTKKGDSDYLSTKSRIKELKFMEKKY